MATQTILLVDDEQMVLQMLKDILEEEGYRTELASNGEEALEKLSKQSYPLVICDVRMPGIDGFEVLQQVKDHYEKTKIILMTGYTEDYEISDALVLGADDYLTKPFDDNRVLLSIRNLLS